MREHISSQFEYSNELKRELWVPEFLLELPNTTEELNNITNGQDMYKFNFIFNDEGYIKPELLLYKYPLIKKVLECVVIKQLESLKTPYKAECVIKRSDIENSKDDDWHVDGWTKYLIANKNPTWFLPDLNGLYRKKFFENNLEFFEEPATEDIKQYDPNVLIRQQSGTIHKRNPLAIGDKDRLLLSISFNNRDWERP